MSETSQAVDPAPYKVRNQVARVATAILALSTLLPFALLVLGYLPAELAVNLVSATLWVWGSILISYVGARVIETAVPSIWRR